MNQLNQLRNLINLIATKLINFETEKSKAGYGWWISSGMVAAFLATILTVGAVFHAETPSTVIQRTMNQEKARKVLEQIRGTSEIESELEDLTLASQISISIHDPFRTILKIKYRPQLVMTVAISFFQQSPESTSSPSTLRSSSVQSEWGKALLRCPPFQSAQSESNLPLNADRRQDEETEAILHRGSPDVRILDPRRRDHGGGAGRPRRDREAARGGCDVLIINYVTGFRLSWGPLGWLVPSEVFSMEIRSAGQSIVVAVIFCSRLEGGWW
ncbi:Hexose carrier protein HEX6 [Linum perenne]